MKSAIHIMGIVGTHVKNRILMMQRTGHTLIVNGASEKILLMITIVMRGRMPHMGDFLCPRDMMIPKGVEIRENGAIHHLMMVKANLIPGKIAFMDVRIA